MLLGIGFGCGLENFLAGFVGGLGLGNGGKMGVVFRLHVFQGDVIEKQKHAEQGAGNDKVKLVHGDG